MEITVSSRSVPVSASLRAAVEEKVAKLGRLLEGMDRAEVHFAEERRRSADGEQCEVTLHGHGHHVRAKVSAPDGFAAIDAAVAKLEHQLRRLKGKLVARQHGRRRLGTDDMAASTTADGASRRPVASTARAGASTGVDGGRPGTGSRAGTDGGRPGTGTRAGTDGGRPGRTRADASADGDGDGDEALERFPLMVRIADEPRVVKTKRFELKPMAPDEAILQMELLSHRFFFFVNSHTGLASVVYRRDDGDIGLIEPR